MSGPPNQIGDEKRDQILPGKSIDEEESKIPKYDFERV